MELRPASLIPLSYCKWCSLRFGPPMSLCYPSPSAIFGVHEVACVVVGCLWVCVCWGCCNKMRKDCGVSIHRGNVKSCQILILFFFRYIVSLVVRCVVLHGPDGSSYDIKTRQRKKKQWIFIHPFVQFFSRGTFIHSLMLQVFVSFLSLVP